LTWVETFERIAAHYTAMAMTSGCWQYAQARVIELESEQGGHWQGLRAEVGRRIKAAGFRPAPSDLTPFERMVELLPQSRRGYGG
jgi:hypothetical protein